MQKSDSLLVRDVMTKHVVTVSPDESAMDVGELLSKNRISGAVVVQDDRILGVISKESFVAGVKYLGENPLDLFKVEDFMYHKFETARADEPLNSVVDRMVDSPHRIDRVLVLDDGKLAGILTKGDITKVFAERAKDCFKVRDLMNLNPSTVRDYTPLTEILSEITLSKEKRVVVTAGEQVLGIITVLDLSLALFHKLKKHPGKDALDYVKLADVITLNPITIKESADAAEAAELMVSKRIGGIPVFDKTLKGMITKSDFVKGYKIFKDRQKHKK
ncbi:MAG: CBS domain-containing protein [Candidatus Altiarchaeales archaeon]|nr:CBS domain-containing protein [Candidatus Altiarchaeales archaeon]